MLALRARTLSLGLFHTPLRPNEFWNPKPPASKIPCRNFGALSRRHPKFNGLQGVPAADSIGRLPKKFLHSRAGRNTSPTRRPKRLRPATVTLRLVGGRPLFLRLRLEMARASSLQGFGA